MKRIAIIIATTLLSLTSTLFAQTTLEVNMQNMHLWRGGEVADGLVLTTDVGFSDQKDRFKVGIWGGTNVVGEYKEFNYYASYKFKGLSFTLVDTYNFSDGANYNNKEFFNYNPSETGRFLDATIKYYFGDKLPLTASWSTVLFGRDRDAQNEYNRYSTFCNLEYKFPLKDRWQIDIGVGAAFSLNEANNKPNFFGSEAGIVQTTLKVSKILQINDFNLPVFALGMLNPQSNQGYLQLGASIILF